MVGFTLSFPIIVVTSLFWRVRSIMAVRGKAFATTHVAVRKTTSQGQGGRGRRVKIGMATMNKHRKRSHKKYRGQGR